MPEPLGLDPDLLALPEMRIALAERDITKVYKLMVAGGVAQRVIATYSCASRPV